MHPSSAQSSDQTAESLRPRHTSSHGATRGPGVARSAERAGALYPWAPGSNSSRTRNYSGISLAQLGHLTRDHRERLARWAELRAAGELAAARLARTGETVERTRDGARVQVLAREAHARGVDYWTARAEGQRARISTVEHCGEGYVTASCSCGDSREVELSCGVARLCVPCRDKQKRERDAQFLRAERACVELADSHDLYRRIRRGGAWGQRHFALTLPHFGGVGQTDEEIAYARVTLSLEAWPLLARALQAWVRDRLVEIAVSQGVIPRARVLRRAHRRAGELGESPETVLRTEDGTRITGRRTYRNLTKDERRRFTEWQRATGIRRVVQWYRSFELTPGGDLLGHPHHHVWIMGPFLAWEELQEWWAGAVRKACEKAFPWIGDELVRDRFGEMHKLREIPGHAINTWIGEATGGIHDEVNKGGDAIKTEQSAERGRPSYHAQWTIAEVTQDGRRASPQVVAQWYIALEGRRMVQASRGFLGMGNRPCCCPACKTETPREATITNWRRAAAERRAAALLVDESTNVIPIHGGDPP